MTIIGVRDLFCFRDKRLEDLRERISNSQATLKDSHFLRKYGIDSRSIRLPAVMGLGAKTKNISLYNAWAIEKSFSGEPYEIFVRSETGSSHHLLQGRCKGFPRDFSSPSGSHKDHELHSCRCRADADGRGPQEYHPPSPTTGSASVQTRSPGNGLPEDEPGRAME